MMSFRPSASSPKSTEPTPAPASPPPDQTNDHDGTVLLLARATTLALRADAVCARARQRVANANAIRLRWRMLKEQALALLERLQVCLHHDEQQRQAQAALAAARKAQEQCRNDLRQAQDHAAHTGAVVSGWRRALEFACRLLPRTTQAATHAQALADFQEAQRHQDHCRTRVERQQQAAQEAAQTAQEAATQRTTATQALQGVQAEGFAAYLQRAPAPERRHLQAVLAEAQQIALAKGGRPPAPSSDPRAEAKAKKAAQARVRRARAQEQPPEPEDLAKAEERRTEHRLKRREARAQARAANDGVTPVVRQHEARMVTMDPARQRTYQRHLDLSRQRGAQALEADLAHRRALGPAPAYLPIHPGVALSEAVRVIAVRGDGADEVLTRITRQEPFAESWLGGPARKRNAAKGARSRLAFAAGHFVVALSAYRRDDFAGGAMDVAVAHLVDSLLARLGLSRHRVVAILHLDSDSRHPHLHLVFARVRADDLSLWNLDGRERTPALWLHGRAQTALALGPSHRALDVDALGGACGSTSYDRRRAALAGELLMANGGLTATHTHLDGTVSTIPLQGPIAAKRLHAVGHLPQELPGGILLFGLGPDPEQQSAWAAAMAQAVKDEDQPSVRHLMANKVPKRGWWLPCTPQPARQDLGKGFEDYLFRGTLRAGPAGAS